MSENFIPDTFRGVWGDFSSEAKSVCSEINIPPDGMTRSQRKLNSRQEKTGRLDTFTRPKFH